MKAIRQYEFGAADVLRYEDVPDPVPGPDEVRIRVAVAGMHLVDTTIRRGSAEGPPLPELPTTPGREVAGVIDVAAVRALHELPGQLSYEAAVALVGTGRTALAVLELAALGPSDVVLVSGAAGGLGALLLQAARRAGAVTVGLAQAA